jgi:hypothetical protein
MDPLRLSTYTKAVVEPLKAVVEPANIQGSGSMLRWSTYTTLNNDKGSALPSNGHINYDSDTPNDEGSLEEQQLLKLLAGRLGQGGNAGDTSSPPLNFDQVDMIGSLCVHLFPWMVLGLLIGW